jgi:hypothetical protein
MQIIRILLGDIYKKKRTIRRRSFRKLFPIGGLTLNEKCCILKSNKKSTQSIPDMKNFLNELFYEINDEWPILVAGFIVGIIWTSILIF